MDLIITNARIVMRDAMVEGTVVVSGGKIREIQEGQTKVPGAVNFEKDLLLPGLIEVHTDNLEKHLIPRPGILWPSPTEALLSHDNQISGAGITTVLNAIFIGEYHKGGMRREILESSIDAIKKTREEGLLRSDHMLHLRCEISDSAILGLFEMFVDDSLVRLVSVMDHTPGQRQWSDLKKYRQFHKDKQWTDKEFEKKLHDRIEMQKKYAVNHRHRILFICRQKQLPVATHDDTTEAHSKASACERFS
jgi:alpha-D-ribose 1-methylphosphonate 5-triphosphate diphosphatase